MPLMASSKPPHSEEASKGPSRRRHHACPSHFQISAPAGNWQKRPSGSALHGKLEPLQLAPDGPVDHPGADFDDHAANQRRVDPNIDGDPAADAAAQLLVK